MCRDNRSNQRLSPDRRNAPPPPFQFSFGHCVDQIAFANRRPIHPISFVQNYFMDFGCTAGSFQRTHHYLYRILILRTGTMGNYHAGMRFWPSFRLPVKHIGRLHSSNGGIFLLLCATIRRSIASHSGSSGSLSMHGNAITTIPFTGFCRFTNHVSSSIR